MDSAALFHLLDNGALMSHGWPMQTWGELFINLRNDPNTVRIFLKT